MEFHSQYNDEFINEMFGINYLSIMEELRPGALDLCNYSSEHGFLVLLNSDNDRANPLLQVLYGEDCTSTHVKSALGVSESSWVLLLVDYAVVEPLLAVGDSTLSRTAGIIMRLADPTTVPLVISDLPHLHVSTYHLPTFVSKTAPSVN